MKNLQESIQQTDRQINDISDNIIPIESRFGTIRIDLEKAIYFHYGILGLPSKINFCITDIPGAEEKVFKILQSVEDHNLAFIILPILADESGKYFLYETKDIENMKKELDIKSENLIIMLISIFENEKDTRIYVNLRAPIIIDAEKKAGLQYVFHNDDYEVRHLL